MELVEFKQILERAGLPVAYRGFPASACPDMPFITYRETGTDNFGADGIVYAEIRQIQVDLFTKNKEVNTEKRLEAVFEAASIFWDKENEDDDDERCHIVTYETEI